MKAYYYLIAVTFILSISIYSCSKDIAEIPSGEQSMSPQFKVVVTEVPIAKISQVLYPVFDTLVDAFNSVQASNVIATDVFISFDGDEYGLVFIVLGEEYDAIEYELQTSVNGEIILDDTPDITNVKTHTCTGAPCSSCSMSSTVWQEVECDCNDTEPEGFCNHTVSSGIVYQEIPNYMALLDGLN